MTVDGRSVAGKTLDISEEVQFLVVGAGPAGIAAAIEGVSRGLGVMLVDEHPVPFETMAESVPLQFGGRMSEIVRNRNGMFEAVLEASPALEEAFELGVDVRLGTACIGVYANTDNLNWMPGSIAALVDEEKGSTLVRFGQCVLAIGRRDMGLAFPGWEQPGVVGATAAVTLARRYKALSGRRAVIIGSTAEAMLDALALKEAGIEIASVVEQAEAPVGPGDLASILTHAGIDIRCGERVLGARGTPTDGVTALLLSGGAEIACDLVVLGVAAVPVVDLFDAAGCQLEFSHRRGGFVPVLDGDGATTLPTLRAAGDCAGVWARKSADPSIAEAEGRRAAALAAAALGAAAGADVPAPAPAPEASFDLGAYRKAWVRSSVIEARREAHVCQCEEVTAREILDVRPPRYLDWADRPNRRTSLAELLGEGPPHPDHVKRLTRAGMGACQGRRCREQVQALLAMQADLPINEVSLASYRAPVRPVPLAVAAALAQSEDPAIRETWDSWFGMPKQWVPFWDVEERYTVASLAGSRHHVSE